MPMPPRLWVPCPGLGDGELPELRPIGAPVARGEALLARRWSRHHIPVAPAAGRVAGLQPVQCIVGENLPAIVFDPDPAQPIVTDSDADLPRSLRETSFSEWIDRLRALGVWADRWASPDLLGQLHLCLKRPIDTVVGNALDQDPSLPLQSRITARWAQEVVHGIADLASLTGAGQAWLVIHEDLASVHWGRLSRAIEGTDVRLVPLRNHYPQANPVLLMRDLNGRRLRPGQLPPEHGVLMLDAAAARAVGRCFRRDQPMLGSPIAIHDSRTGATEYIEAPVGASLKAILSGRQINFESTRLFAGVPLLQRVVTPASVVAGGELTFYATPRGGNINPDPCIRCAWCVEACPVRIQPAGLLDAAQEQDLPLAEEYGLAACIECGICSFVCPSQLPLLQGIRHLRRAAHVSAANIPPSTNPDQHPART